MPRFNQISRVLIIGFLIQVSAQQTVQSQESLNPPTSSAPSQEAPTKSPTAALLSSLGGTAIGFGGVILAFSAEPVSGIIIGGTGFLFGPSIGHMYTGDWGRVVGFTLGRGASMGLVFAGATDAFRCTFSDNSNCKSGGWGWSLVTVGVLGLLTFTIWDIVDSPASATRYNEEHAKPTLALSPLIVPPPKNFAEATPGLGLVLSGRF